MLKKPIYDKVLKEALGEVPSYRVAQENEPWAGKQLIPLGMDFGDSFVEIYNEHLNPIEWTVYVLEGSQFYELRSGKTYF